MERVGHGPSRLACLQPRRTVGIGIGIGIGHGPLDLVELTEELQRLLADLAAVVGPEFVALRRACAMQPASVTPRSKQAL
jgi:hypothetical protein